MHTVQTMQEAQPPISLRERRRRQTQREIQTATLELAREIGLEAVTTEAIAQRAGVSKRTFFNYFLNKEAAAIGVPPPFPQEAVADFRAGRGPLLEDLRRLLRIHAHQLEQEREAIEAIAQLTGASLAMRQLHDQVLLGLRDTLAEIIAARVACAAATDSPEAAHEVAEALAGVVMLVTRTAIDGWRDGAAADLPSAMDAAWDRYQVAARLLASG